MDERPDGLPVLPCPHSREYPGAYGPHEHAEDDQAARKAEGRRRVANLAAANKAGRPRDPEGMAGAWRPFP